MKGGKRAKGKSTEKAEVQERLDDIARRAALVLSDEQDCGTRCSPSSSKKRGTMAEKAEDELLLKRDESETDEKRGTTAISQPRILKNGTLRSYQMVGLQWLVELYRTGRCGILADEMGLGKTVQAIAMIAYLTEHNIAAGEKTLIVAPKSVNGNWYLIPSPCLGAQVHAFFSIALVSHENPFLWQAQRIRKVAPIAARDTRRRR